MSWLAHNVVGHVPAVDELTAKGRAAVRASGVAKDD